MKVKCFRTATVGANDDLDCKLEEYFVNNGLPISRSSDDIMFEQGVSSSSNISSGKFEICLPFRKKQPYFTQ